MHSRPAEDGSAPETDTEQTLPALALISWPFVAIALFLALGPGRGLVWSVVIGYLFLPEAFTLGTTGLPDYAKQEAIALGALLGLAFTARRAPPKPESDPFAQRVFMVLILILLIGPVLTMLTNREVVVFGPTVLRSIRPWDVQAQLVATFVPMVFWLLARRYLHTAEMQRELLKAMTTLGLFYTLLVLFEMRMSPQLNNMIYGYFPHYWMQHIRGGGFRAIVFLDHGLSVGFFLTTAVLAAVGLTRAYSKGQRAFYLISAIWLFLVLAVSRNLGALALGLLLLPAAAMLSFRLQVRIAVIVGVLFVINPLVRDSYVQPLLTAAEKISDERMRSLKTRFDNEEVLLARAAEKPLAGWGPWGRWRPHDEYGRDSIISDGTWIITLGKWGWLGFAGLFGVFIVPMLLIGRAARRTPLTSATAVLALMTAANLIYLIPNATLSPIGWMAAGAMAGFAQYRRAAPNGEESAAVKPSRPEGPVYSRFGPGSSGRPVTRTSHPRPALNRE